MQTLFIGTYPAAGFGTPAGVGEGIWRVTLTGDGELRDARQVAATPAPSFLCAGPSPDVIYAVNECPNGTVTAWRRNRDRLVAAGEASTGGSDPCHLRYVDALGALVATNYSSGSVAVIPVGRDGGLPSAAPTQVMAFEGSGPVAERQAGPHAHQSVPTPDGRFLLVNDLGSDTVWRSAIDGGALRFDGTAGALPAGAGPRHGAFLPTEPPVYVVAGELDDNLYALEWDAASGVLTPLSAVPGARRGGAVMSHVEAVGDRVLVGCRGSDVVSRFALDAGRLHPDGEFPLSTGGFARHHRVVGESVVVALQRTHEIVVLGPDGARREGASIPSPACILPTVE